MAEPGPEPGYAWRVLALCGAAVFLAAAAAGAALLAWNLAAAASRGSHCPDLELGVNATVPPGDPTLEVQELQRQLAEAAQREEALARQLDQAKAAHRELEEALRACESRQVGGQSWGLGPPECGGGSAYTQECPLVPWFPQFFCCCC